MQVKANAHKVAVHREITARAIREASAINLFLYDTLGDSILHPESQVTFDTDRGKLTAKQLIIEGSDREDDEEGAFYKQRAYNHFYDPITKTGLSDR